MRDASEEYGAVTILAGATETETDGAQPGTRVSLQLQRTRYDSSFQV